MDVIELEFCYNPNVGAASRGMDPDVPNVTTILDATSVEDAVKKVYDEVFGLDGEELEYATEGDYTPEYLIQFGDDQDASGGDPILFWVNIAGKHYESSIWEESDFEYEDDEFEYDDDGVVIAESVKKGLREDGRSFGQRFKMTKKDFDAWQSSTSKEGLADVRDIDGVKACYVNSFDKTYGRNMPKHIGTWNPETEELACDDVSMFGHVKESKSNLREDFDEPAWDIYCSYSDCSGGERDGDPRYEEVEFDALEDILRGLCADFLLNKLKGSYNWSPVDHFVDEEEGMVGFSTAEYENYEYQDECELNKLRISCMPVRGTEDGYVIILRGDGEIVKDTYGLPEEDNPEGLMENKKKDLKENVIANLNNIFNSGKKKVNEGAEFTELGAWLKKNISEEDFEDFCDFVYDVEDIDFTMEDPNAIWSIRELENYKLQWMDDCGMDVPNDPELSLEYNEDGSINTDLAYSNWLASVGLDVSNEDAYFAGAEFMGNVVTADDYNLWLEQFAPNYDVSNEDAFHAGAEAGSAITDFDSATDYKDRTASWEEDNNGLV